MATEHLFVVLEFVFVFVESGWSGHCVSFGRAVAAAEKTQASC